MIAIDPRAGSKNLIKLFPEDMVRVMTLPACDLLLTNEYGSEYWTGVEHKRIGDVLQCIVNGRFAGTQLPGMAAIVNDYWLLIEGPFKKSISGELLVPWKYGQWCHAKVGNREFKYNDLESWIITMTTCTPLKVKITQSRLETKDWVLTLHSWWEKGKDKHHSHMVTDRSRESPLVRASLMRRIAEQLPGVGLMKAMEVEKYFGSNGDAVFNAMVADREEWQKIEGIGPKMAERIVTAIRGKTRHGMD